MVAVGRSVKSLLAEEMSAHAAAAAAIHVVLIVLGLQVVVTSSSSSSSSHIVGVRSPLQPAPDDCSRFTCPEMSHSPQPCCCCLIANGRGQLNRVAMAFFHRADVDVDHAACSPPPPPPPLSHSRPGVDIIIVRRR